MFGGKAKEVVFLLLGTLAVSQSFIPQSTLQAQGFKSNPSNIDMVSFSKITHSPVSRKNVATKLQMGLDLVTYLRTEFISAALCTNQTPRSADVCLQLGTDDGRAITFVPRTIRQFITSTFKSKSSVDSGLGVATRRQINQQKQRRGTDVEIIYSDQLADDLVDTDNESVDVVISLQAAAKMVENDMDWKKSVQEASRVLKPGGRFLFCEQTELNGVKYLDYVTNLGTLVKGGEEDEEIVTVFSEVGTDDVDLVLVPHVAGVAIKSEDAGLSKQERAEKLKKEEEERYAELSLSAFERGAKKRRKKKKKKNTDEDDA